MKISGVFLPPFGRCGKWFFEGRFVLQEISLRLKEGEHFVLRIIYVLLYHDSCLFLSKQI